MPCKTYINVYIFLLLICLMSITGNFSDLAEKPRRGKAKFCIPYTGDFHMERL